MAEGKLIVIEGTDGSGKGTQLQLLVDYLKEKRYPHETVDFPQYYKSFFGRFVGRFLKGEFGGIKEVHPYLIMLSYAADRWTAKHEMDEWLSQGKLVLSNRYATSCVYQAAKLPKGERQKFIDWSFEMEYKAYGIPKEDLVIFLYVPYDVSHKLIEQKANRKYLNNGKIKDIHESNEALMREVENVYLDFCKKYPHWIKIDCTKNGQILSRQEIHQKILDVLKKKKVL